MFDVLRARVFARYVLGSARLAPATLRLGDQGYLAVTGEDRVTDAWNFEVTSLDLHS